MRTIIIYIIFFVSSTQLKAQNANDKEKRDEFYQIIRTYLDAWERNDRELFLQVLSPDFVDYMYGQPRTLEQLLNQATNPQVKMNTQLIIEEFFVDGDVAVIVMSNHLVHEPTGKEAHFTGMIIARIRDGKIVEGWGSHDRLGQLQQFGVLPTTSELRSKLMEVLRPE